MACVHVVTLAKQTLSVVSTHCVRHSRTVATTEFGRTDHRGIAMTDIDLTLLNKVLIHLQDDLVIEADNTPPAAAIALDSVAVPGHIDVSRVRRSPSS